MGLGSFELGQEVAQEDWLELTNGVVVKSALELLEALKDMDSETFSHHVSLNHNDFSDWIEENYHDEVLGRQILKAAKRGKIIRVLERALLREMKEFVRERKRKNKIRPLKRKKEILREIADG